MKLTTEKYPYLHNYLYGINYLILRLSNPFDEYHKIPLQGLTNVVLEKILNREIIKNPGRWLYCACLYLYTGFCEDFYEDFALTLIL